MEDGSRSVGCLRSAGEVAQHAVLATSRRSGRTVTEAPGKLCAVCWAKIVWLASPLSARCGLPFEFDHPHDALCGACLRDPPVFERARAVFRYDDASRGLILAFKHADRLH